LAGAKALAFAEHGKNVVSLECEGIAFGRQKFNNDRKAEGHCVALLKVFAT